MRSLVLSLLFLAASGVANAGEPPEAQFAQAAKKLLEARLRDPGSVQYRNLGVYRPLEAQGRSLCGEFNAKNSLGGYVGFKRFWVDRDGQVRVEGNGPDETAPELFGALRLAHCDRLLKAVK